MTIQTNTVNIYRNISYKFFSSSNPGNFLLRLQENCHQKVIAINIKLQSFNVCGKFLFIAFCIICMGKLTVYGSYKVFSTNLYRYFTQQFLIEDNRIGSLELSIFVYFYYSSARVMQSNIFWFLRCNRKKSEVAISTSCSESINC